MRRIVTGALTLTLAFSFVLGQSQAANANALAGGGYSSSYSGESDFTNKAAGESGSFTARFFNDGTVSWAPSVVGLLICLADKTTCNVASPNAAYAKNWFSTTVYASTFQNVTVPAGSIGFFTYDFTVPAGTAGGTVATFNGDLGLISGGTELRPEGYFQVNTTPAAAAGALTISPSSASVALNSTQQFTASGAPTGTTVAWSVTGGCGAVTTGGLFAATAVNSPTQPCTVVATAGGLTASAAVTVFGPPASITCSASAASIVGNGSSTVDITGTLKDANGNTVANNSATNISFADNTPTLITPTGTTVKQTASGAATVTYTSVANVTGSAQVSLSSGSLTGCSQTVTITGIGAANKTAASVSPGTIGADGVSTSRLRVDIQDSAGNRILTDSSTVVTVSQQSGSNICNIAGAGSASATASSGRVNFTVTSTTTPGTCTWAASTNPSVTGSTATLTTIILGAPNQLAVITSSSTLSAQAGDTANPVTVVVELRDANGARVTGSAGSGVTITETFSTSSSAGSGCPSALTPASGGTTTTGTVSTAGRATFTFNSTAATSGCTITFSDGSGVSSTTGTIVFTPGPASGVACSFSPAVIKNDGSSTSTATANVVDSNGNATGTGAFSMSFSRSSGTSTTLLTSSPQTTTNGAASFTVRSTTTVGTDTYTASATVTGSSASSGTCNIVVSSNPPNFP